jgi:hypothetical protein
MPGFRFGGTWFDWLSQDKRTSVLIIEAESERVEGILSEGFGKG